MDIIKIEKGKRTVFEVSGDLTELILKNDKDNGDLEDELRPLRVLKLAKTKIGHVGAVAVEGVAAIDTASTDLDEVEPTDPGEEVVGVMQLSHDG